MKKINKFFLVGTLGILFTAMANIIQEALQPSSESHFIIFYPLFMLILLYGTGVMIKKKEVENK